MVKETIKSQSIIPRIDGIERDLEKLEDLGKLPLDILAIEDNFIKAQFYLRRVLEGVFSYWFTHTCTHAWWQGD